MSVARLLTGPKRSPQYFEKRGQTVLFRYEDGVWIIIPFQVVKALPEIPPPLIWNSELHEKVVKWAGWVAGKMRFDDDTRDDLVSECLIKAHRQVKAGKIRTVSGLNTLCRRKGLDMVRKRIRVASKETELVETSDGPVGGECYQEDMTLPKQVHSQFPELVEASMVIAAGGSWEEAARAVGMDYETFRHWYPQEQEAAAEFYGVNRGD